MWEIKIKLKHDCTIGNRCKKFKCQSFSLTLSNWEENNIFYTSQRHNLIGKPKNIINFINNLRKDRRIYNLKVFNNDIFFIEKRTKKNIPSSFYNQGLIFVAPVKVNEEGEEIWILAADSKDKLKNFYENLKNSSKVNYINVIYLKNKNIVNKLSRLSQKNNIVNRLDFFLESKLGVEKKRGQIEGEQWFRDFEDWIFIAFNNPYNWKKPNSELSLLEEKSKLIYSYISDSTLIFYGAGVGETELEIVRQILEKEKICEIVAIDINNIFLNLFEENLKNKEIEYPKSKILYKGYNACFQNMMRDDFNFQNSSKNRNVHICLGGTIGNFKNQDEIFTIFKNNTKKGDILLLAVQLDKNINQIFKKYYKNRYFPKFILNFENKINTNLIKWKLDKKENIIKMIYQNIEVFRSKKYSIRNLNNKLKNFDFKLLKHWIDNNKNVCILIFKKI